MHTLHIVIVSTRQGRHGVPVASWFNEVAHRHGKFNVELIDLAEMKLPLFDEPNHPRLQQYEHEHTKKWSAKVKKADAFVFVTPEYNYGSPPSFTNAIDYLLKEWKYKAVGFVSYGGVSGGTRAVQMEKQTVTAVGMMPIPEAVTIPFFAKQITDGVFTAHDHQEKSALTMLDELARWTDALKVLRS